VLGEEHPDTLTSMANLASTYRNQGRVEVRDDDMEKEKTKKKIAPNSKERIFSPPP
jgi:hypothetical protein